jgi:hypothetical protein
MSLDDAREIFPVAFFPPGSQESGPLLDARPKAVEEEPEETSVPKDSSVQGSANSSLKPEGPEQTPPETPSSNPPAPPAPPAPSATVDKDSGKPKGSENSTPTGS